MTEQNTSTSAVKEIIKMADGREVAFSAKTKIVKEAVREGDQAFVRFDARNGETRVLDLSKCDLVRLALHGAESKCGDEYAGLTSVDDCVQALDEVIARLERHEWNAVRTGNGGTQAGGSVLAKALMEIYGKTAQEISVFLSQKTQAEKMALRKSDKIAPTIARLEAAASNKTVDVSAALAELESL